MKTSPSSKTRKEKSESERARDSLTRYLAVRDHSRLELERKLARRYDGEVVREALEWAERNRLLLPGEQLSERMAQQLGRRLKSHRQIELALRDKGLPSTGEDRGLELEKIRRLLEKRFHFNGKLSYEERVKAYRYLKYRGFNDSLIKQVLHEKP